MNENLYVIITWSTYFNEKYVEFKKREKENMIESKLSLQVHFKPWRCVYKIKYGVLTMEYENYLRHLEIDILSFAA